MRIYRIIIFIGLLLLAACGSVSTVGNPNNVITSDTALYDASLEVAPSFTPEESSSLSPLMKEVSTDWESGNPVYEIFYILQEFNDPEDQGVIDTSNIFKTMWESRNFMSRTEGSCQAITEQTIVPPFDLGNEAATYNCAYNDVDVPSGYDFGGALKELDANGSVIEMTDTDTSVVVQHGLFGFVWVDQDDSHFEYGTVQGTFDASSDDLSIDFAVWVDYEGENDYCYRNDIDGNAETHVFTFRSVKGNIQNTTMSIVGKGVSQGEGNYFLLKASTGDVTDKYYCIGAEDGETELKLMDAEGSDTVDENCADYETDVDALVPFTVDDLLCESSDLNPGVTDEPAVEGTIYLDFE